MVKLTLLITRQLNESSTSIKFYINVSNNINSTSELQIKFKLLLTKHPKRTHYSHIFNMTLENNGLEPLG